MGGELQTRLAAERFAHHDREPSMIRDGSLDALVFNGQHSHHQAHATMEGRGTSPQSAALAQSLRRNRSVESRSESNLSGVAVAHASETNPPGPGMGRSHSLGDFISNVSVSDDKPQTS